MSKLKELEELDEAKSDMTGAVCLFWAVLFAFVWAAWSLALALLVALGGTVLMMLQAADALGKAKRAVEEES